MKKPSQRRSGIDVLPAGYSAFFKEIKTRIRVAQTRAALAANSELIHLYWDIGRRIVERQQTEGWGTFVIDRLAADLQRTFPGVGGFSKQNIWKMRMFYLAWSNIAAITPQPVGQILSRPVRELRSPALPPVLLSLPWGQNTELIFKIKDPVERLWYAHQTVEHGWSRPVLQIQMESDLFRRQGKATTNFKDTLPPPQSDLAQQAIKDPCVSGYVTRLVESLPQSLQEAIPSVDEIEKELTEQKPAIVEKKRKGERRKSK